MRCELPQSLTFDAELHLSLSMRLLGHKGESLVYSLGRWITFYTNSRVTSMHTSEPGIVFEGIDREILIKGGDLSTKTECFFIDPSSATPFFRHLARQTNPDEPDKEVICAIPVNLVYN